MVKRKDSRGRALETGETQRKDGKYSYRYTDSIGKRHEIYASDLAKLREKEKKIKIMLWQDVDVGRGNTTTLNDVFDRYMETKFGLKKTTFANYLKMYDRYVRDEFGKRFLRNIRYSDIQGFYSGLIKYRGIGIRTVEYVHMLLHPTFELAVRDGLIMKNPTQGILGDIKKVYGYAGSKIKALTMDEQKIFLEFLEGHPHWSRYHSIFQVMLGTGLRSSEFTGLRWEDVDFEKRLVNVNHSIVTVREEKNGRKSYLHVSLPKTVAGIRTVPMMQQVVEAFKKEYLIAESKNFASCDIEGYTDFIFTKATGNVYTSERLDKALKDIIICYNKQEDAIAKAEEREPVHLPHISCHSLRHTFCTRLCERDVNLKVIQTVMGHANIKVTMDIYAEVSMEKQRQEIEAMADELDGF